MSLSVAAGRSHWASDPPALLMVPNEAYASREIPAIFSLDCERLKSTKIPVMNDAHFVNEIHSSAFFLSTFLGDND
jgi:hypothetical protein